MKPARRAVLWNVTRTATLAAVPNYNLDTQHVATRVHHPGFTRLMAGQLPAGRGGDSTCLDTRFY